jgi:RNA-directed DNA polymerase
LNRYRSREIRQALVGPGNVHSLLSELISSWDPYQPGIRLKLKSAYETAALNAWFNAKTLFPTQSPIEALENTWASIAHLAYLRKFLEIGVAKENHAPTVKRLLEIKDYPNKNSENDFDLHSLLYEHHEDITPDLLGFTGFSDEIRIRWSLAFKVQKERPYLDFLKSAGFISTIETKRAVALLSEAIKFEGAKSRKRIGWKQVLLLSDKEFEIICANADISRNFFKDLRKNFLDTVKLFTEKRIKFKNDFELTKVSLENLKVRNWRIAGEAAAKITVDDISKLAAKTVLAQTGFARKSEDEELKTPWSAMDKAGYECLIRILGHKVISQIYCFTSEKIAELLVDGKLSQDVLHIKDIAQLNNSWTAHTKKQLISAGLYKVISDDDTVWSSFSLKTLAHAALSKGRRGERLLSAHVKEFKNAQEILEAVHETGSKQVGLLLKKLVEQSIILKNWRSRMKQASWMTVLFTEIGTDLWTDLVTKGLIDHAKFEDVIYALSNDSSNTTLKLFEDQAIAALKAIKKLSYENAVGITIWITKSPDSAGLIAQALTDGHIKSILKIKPGDCSVFAIKQLYLQLPEENKLDFWEMLMSHVTDADDLISIGIDGLQKGFTIKWNPRWNHITGTRIKRAKALCLMAYRDGEMLRYLASRNDQELMTQSLFWVANNIPKISVYDRVSLELSATLGLRHWSTIRWLLSERDPKKLPGKKFDHLYTNFQIPKKSGKTRLISAPSDGLKRIQKSILLRLLNPLGAHASAFGFLPNKSILDNASPHVGRPIVINVDIQNCFPNVAWQLVLAALNRDLSTKLSDKSISFLVDVCTSNGSLPIGSPTSPALLNRVLVNTDNILSNKAGLKECTYTRYADDLTFSGDEKALQMIGIAKSVLSRIGLHLDPIKTNIFRSGRRQICTGLVVNDKVSVPRNIRRRIRAAIHSLRKENKLHWDGQQMSTSSLRGRIEFVKMVSPGPGSILADRFKLAFTSSTKTKKTSRREISSNFQENDRD